MFTLHEGPKERRCPCCRRKVTVYCGHLLNERTRDWDNIMCRARAAQLAKDGVCPFCGAKTTIVGRTLLARFEPMLLTIERALL